LSTRGKGSRRRVRQPDATRQKLLKAAFAEIHEHGYQAASLETILAGAGVTKGALYHHFENKAQLGHAVLDEVIVGLVLSDWLEPLEEQPDDPLSAMHEALRRKVVRFASGRGLQLGCPLNNLANEMSPIDETFRRRVDAAFARWRGGFAAALQRGKLAGTVRADVDPERVAAFLVAAAEGSIGLAKSARSIEVLRSNYDLLGAYLETLR
jgi:TetR/AcrR family transcriptional regulator, transcriptional repressor for nem operon